MNRFVQLFLEIDATTKTNEKVEALVNYFHLADAKDLLWAIALLMGNKPKRPVKTTQLRQWAAELRQLPLWLLEESYFIVGDLAETLSLIVYNDDAAGTDLSLTQVVTDLKMLLTATDEEKKNYITRFWANHNQPQNFVFNKLITGNFRMGVSRQLVIKALARFLNKDEKDTAHQLMGKWDPEEETLQGLFGSQQQARHHLPYPFFLAYPLEAPPDEALGDLNEWFFEKKYDGIRGQIIVRNNQVFVWSRGEELVTDKFPEFETLHQHLPDGTVIDGEIIPWKDDQPLPFAIMQIRIGRKNLSKKILTEAPLVMICYDLMEYAGEDIREKPLWERRNLLAALLQNESVQNILLLSPLVDLHSWDEVAEFRANARDEFCEGLMIKRKNSIYETGRRRGNWWKWKTSPMTIDGVLIYAQSGSGRRANLFTDYTFAVWHEGKLVPFTKAYSGLTDKEILRLDNWVKRNTIEKFGPVRSVQPVHVFEIAFEGIAKSTRHKSGVALRFPRISRWREDKPAEEANTLEDLNALLETYHKNPPGADGSGADEASS